MKISKIAELSCPSVMHTEELRCFVVWVDLNILVRYAFLFKCDPAPLHERTELCDDILDPSFNQPISA